MFEKMTGKHVSEWAFAQVVPDVIIENNATLRDFEKKIDKFIASLL